MRKNQFVASLLYWLLTQYSKKYFIATFAAYYYYLHAEIIINPQKISKKN